MLLRISLLTFLVCAAVFSQQPEYRAARTAGPIVVDGRLTEFTWMIAPQVGVFRHIRDVERRDVARTQAALAWDDHNLYVMFVCEDRLAWGDMFERDAHLWEQEVVELFLDPDGDGKDYPELEVSPHNVVVDLLIPAPGEVSADEAAKWDIEGLQTAVGKSGAGWTVEMSIPWASLSAAGVTGAPRPGERWRVGLYRIERPGGIQKDRDESGDQFLAWAVTEKSFHEPEKFGVVEFVLK